MVISFKLSRGLLFHYKTDCARVRVSQQCKKSVNFRKDFHEKGARNITGLAGWPRSLSDLKNRSEKEAERGQILTISPGNSRSIAQESGEI